MSKHHHCRVVLAIAIVSLCFAATGLSSPAQAPAAGELSARILPSVAQLSIQNSDGTRTVANGFLTMKDGILAVPLHLVGNARAIVARFSNGEEYECTGIVDRDEKRNVALVRIRVFGKPMLKMEPAKPAPESAVRVAVIKDSAYGIVPASIAATGSFGGIEVLRLNGDIPENNSGSPVIDDQGNVLGILNVINSDKNANNEKHLFLLFPAAYILALDSTLPTKSWGAGDSRPPAPSSAAAPKANSAGSTDEAVDNGLASAIMFVYEMYARAYGFTQNIFSMTKYSTVDNAIFYNMQSEVDNVQTQCQWLKTSDPLRAKLLQGLSQVLARQKAVLEYCVQCNLMNNASPRNNPEQAQDFAKRAFSTLTALPDQLALLHPDFRALAQSSPQFAKALPVEMGYVLGINERRSRLLLGAYVHPKNPRVLLLVFNKGLADELGLRGGDALVSVGGQEIKDGADIEDFKLMIEANAGKTLDVVVERYGKKKAIKMKVPAQFAEKYLRPQSPPVPS